MYIMCIRIFTLWWRMYEIMSWWFHFK